MSSRMAGSVLLRYVSARHLFTVAVTSLAAAARPLLTGGDNALPADVKIENVPAPAIAIYYWRLPADAKLKDVVIVVRADEAHHRDVNHYASDIHYKGMKLK